MNKIPCQSQFVDQDLENGYADDLLDDEAESAFYAMKMPQAVELLSQHFHEDGGEDIVMGLAHWITCHGDTKAASLNELVDKVKDAVLPALKLKLAAAKKEHDE